MRRINIMVEVPDEVYSNVIEPYKKSHKLKKLIELLLEGFMDEPNISEYVNKGFSNNMQEGLESLNSTIATMRGHISMMELLNESAMAMAEKGKKAVSLSNSFDSSASTVGEEAEPIVENISKGTSPRKINDNTSEEYQSEIDALKKQNLDVLSKLATLAEAVEKLSNSNKSEEVKAEVKPHTLIKKEDSNSKVEEVKTQSMDMLDITLDEDDPLAAPVDLFDESEIPDLEDEEVKIEDNEAEEDEFFKNMLDGQVYSF